MSVRHFIFSALRRSGQVNDSVNVAKDIPGIWRQRLEGKRYAYQDAHNTGTMLTVRNDKRLRSTMSQRRLFVKKKKNMRNK